MAFVRVTDPDTLFELWVSGLLYNKYDAESDSTINFCEYNGTDVSADREHYVPHWRNGQGIEPDDVYGVLLED